MPMGVVSDHEFEKELKNSSIEHSRPEITPSSVITGEVIDSPIKGRGKNNVAVPESIQKIIGETNELEGRKSALAFAQSLGLSASSVSAYANGAASTATYDKPKPEIKKHIDDRKSVVAGNAMTRLSRALKVLSEDKIATANAREVAGIAKDMAAIVKMMEPESGQITTSNTPQFVVYAPQFKNENHFETIVAKDDF